MLTYENLKLAHTVFALSSIAGFTLRAYYKLTEQQLLQSKTARILPHLLDSLLLASAAGMLLQLKLSPFASPWLTAKIMALLLYITFGMLCLRFAKTTGQSFTAAALALITAAYILSVALSKNPCGFMVLTSYCVAGG